MKINEVESLLGITKANIRFYEREGLLFPARSPNGYRDYGEADIARLKQIIILRKLGIPVQQIADILDGALPLQDALDESIQNIQSEMERLSGSLALCKQLKQEGAQEIDPERCWDLIEEKQKQGQLFQELKEDYTSFLLHSFSLRGFSVLAMARGEKADKEDAKYGLGLYLVLALVCAGFMSYESGNFLGELGSILTDTLFQIGKCFLVLLVPLTIGHFFPKYKKKAIDWTLILLVLIGLILTIWKSVAPFL